MTVILIMLMGSWCPNWIVLENLDNEQFSAALLPFIRARTKSLKRIGPHNKDILCIIVSGMLADWWGLKISGNSLPSVQFNIEQSAKHSTYIHKICSELFELGYCSSYTPKLIVRVNKNSHNKIQRFYRVTLFSFTSLFWIYEGFYQNIKGCNIKVVPSWVADYITPRGLAEWVCQDGSRQKKQGISLAANCFTYNECVFLAKILTSKFNLKTSVVKAGIENQWKISILKDSMPDLASLIGKYLVPEMRYKLEGFL